MPKKYPTEVKLFAIENKKQGHSWEQVSKLITEKFNISSPDRRQMSKWFKELKNKDNLEHALEVHTQEKAEDSKIKALSKITESLLPQLKEARNMGEDIEYSGWRWFFEIQEHLLGSKKFWNYLDQYHLERGNKPEYPPIEL